MNQGGNYWTLFTPGIWKVLHAVFQPSSARCPYFRCGEIARLRLTALKDAIKRSYVV
jgi:hypothetical protein